MNEYIPTRQDLTSVGVPYKQSFVIDVSQYQDSITSYDAMLLHRLGFNIEQIFAMAFRLFSMFSPKRERGHAPPMIPMVSLSTIVDSVQPFRTAVTNAHTHATTAGTCKLSYENFKRLVADNVIRMYLCCYPYYAQLYLGIIDHYHLDGVLIETVNVTCHGNRIYFGVFNVL